MTPTSRAAAAAFASLAQALFQTDWSQAGAPNQMVAPGTVPDEATRAAIIARLREVYGADGVSDRLGVGTVVAPPTGAATCAS